MSIQELTTEQLRTAVLRRKVQVDFEGEVTRWYYMKEMVTELDRRSTIDLRTDTISQAIGRLVEYLKDRILYFGPEFNSKKVLFHLERALKASQKKE